jgi:hypothetical protein
LPHNDEGEWGDVNLREGPETISHSEVFMSAEVRKGKAYTELGNGQPSGQKTMFYFKVSGCQSVFSKYIKGNLASF